MATSRPLVSPRDPRKLSGTVFGGDPETYDAVRLPYPQRIYEILERRCGLGRGKAVFEIGPGTGKATRELLRHGAGPLLLIEADRRLVRFLRRSLGPRRAGLRILPSSFERAKLPAASFDLGVAASSFHWIRPGPGMTKVARALRAGGWFCFWNNHHRDPFRPSRFVHALDTLYQELEGSSLSIWHGMGSDAKARAAFRQERDRILGQLRSTDAFERVRCETIHWRMSMETDRIVHLWSTFSDTVSWSVRSRAWFLAEMRGLVENEFGGQVTIPILTPVYSARRV